MLHDLIQHSPTADKPRAESLQKLIHEFENPSDEFSPMPFWFWNDTLTEAEISRQMHAFKEKGVNGFVIHPRLGLDPAIPYMGEAWLFFVEYAVSLAQSLDMKVILYDEAMYPSGSCCGQVVAEDPSFATMGLRMSDSPLLDGDEKLIAQTSYKENTVFFILTPSGGHHPRPLFRLGRRRARCAFGGGSAESAGGGDLYPTDPSKILRPLVGVFRQYRDRYFYR